QAHGAFPEINSLATELAPLWSTKIELPDLEFKLIVGDARKTLPSWRHKADAWFLDGFSPAKNPELWGAALMQEVATHTKTGGSFATYSASGSIRRSLEDGGFKVERITGFGRKRHMTKGKKL
ncbi:MAG: tRNA (5-methylaminomethyl-2-thiouridine)(34)-methyltransferase MnmD, partial [Planktomarina sp.]|nr:tRNA (5-methylaminomethyl-2-thiouridine)(34)-methyltransferase MnmD [Planktomarina sp.]